MSFWRMFCNLAVRVFAAVVIVCSLLALVLILGMVLLGNGLGAPKAEALPTDPVPVAVMPLGGAGLAGVLGAILYFRGGRGRG